MNRRERRARQSSKGKKKVQAEAASAPNPAASGPQTGTQANTAPVISDQEAQIIWDKFLQAVKVEPKRTEFIRGASGLQHPVKALGVNEDEKRLVIISGETSARAAALAQADIQSALKDHYVVVARPVAINVSLASSAITAAIGSDEIRFSELPSLPDDQKSIEAFLHPILERLLNPAVLAFSSFGPHLIQIIEQLRNIKFENFLAENSAESATKLSINLRDLNRYDPTEMDRLHGVCPVPLYDFTPDEFQSVLSSQEIEDVRDLLTKHDLYQYFFPAPDQLALGIVDRAKIISVDELISQVSQAPSLGHPFAAPELSSSEGSLFEVVDGLKERGLVVEGELSLETTPAGKSLRQTVKFKPREGLVSKVLNHGSIRDAFKELIRIGGRYIDPTGGGSN